MTKTAERLYLALYTSPTGIRVLADGDTRHEAEDAAVECMHSGAAALYSLSQLPVQIVRRGTQFAEDVAAAIARWDYDHACEEG